MNDVTLLISSRIVTHSRCFYLNPIISAVAMIPVLLLWKGSFIPDSGDDKPRVKEILRKFDYPGILIFAAAVVALLLGLQYGGSSYSWSDGRTISSLTVAGMLFLVFTAVEFWKGSEAIVPVEIIRNRVVSLSTIYTATLDGAYFIMTYQVCIPPKAGCRCLISRYLYSCRSRYGFNRSLGSQHGILDIEFCPSSYPVSSR